MEKEENFSEKDFYREKIVEMVWEIENPRFIKMIYGFVKSLFEEKEEG